MKIARIRNESGDEQWICDGDPSAIPSWMLGRDEGGVVGTWTEAADRYAPPVPPPEKIICIGLNYRDHALETGADIPTEPIGFGKYNTALVGHGDAIVLPPLSKQVDYEAELVVVIGRRTKCIGVDEAMQHVLGYACGHDVSARDWQKGRPGGQWLLGKSFDTFAPVGPWIVTADELGDARDVEVVMDLPQHRD